LALGEQMINDSDLNSKYCIGVKKGDIILPALYYTPENISG